MDRVIEEYISVEGPFTTVRDLLEHEPVPLLGTPAPDDGSHWSHRRAVAEVGVELGGGTSARQEVVVEIDPTADEHGPDVRWPIRWHPVGHTRVLPSFDGVLRAVDEGDTTTLHLRGTYHPPLGVLGAAGDAVLGRRVAGATAAALLSDVADRITMEAERRPVPPAANLPSNYSLVDPWSP